MHLLPFVSLAQQEIVLGLGLHHPSVHLVQGHNLSWFGYPQDTSPSSRDFAPGLGQQQQQQPPPGGEEGSQGGGGAAEAGGEAGGAAGGGGGGPSHGHGGSSSSSSIQHKYQVANQVGFLNK